MFVRLLISSVMIITPISAFSSECGEWHSIVRGDSISALAEKAYGNARDYDRIYQANLETIGDNPARVEIGMDLYIPCTDTSETGIEGWYELPEPADLANLQKLHDIQIIDIRPADKTGDEFIADSISVPWLLWRGPSDNPGQPPSETELSALLGDNGIQLDQPTIIVHGQNNPMDMGRAAMVYWLLKSSGAGQIAILSGGMQGWKAAGLGLVDTSVTRQAYGLDISFDNTWRATPAEVEAISSGSVRGTLVDARPAGIFAKINGEGQHLATTLPKAVNISGPAAFSTYKAEYSEVSILDRLKGSNVNWEADPIINFCNTGEIGALNWFYASELSGIKNVKLYPESSHGWKQEGHDLAPGNIVQAYRR